VSVGTLKYALHYPRLLWVLGVHRGDLGSPQLFVVGLQIPRITYQPRLRWGGKNPGITITLSVYDLSVEPAEVARAYRYVRSELLGSDVFPFPARRPRQRIRSSNNRTRAMLSFCRARKSTMKFPQILKEWNAASPQWAYETPKSLYNAYKAAEVRWGVPKRARGE
jgi:hypothetical protein